MHPFNRAMMNRNPLVNVHAPIYVIGSMYGRGWFSKAVKKVGKATVSTAKFVRNTVDAAKSIANDPAIQKLIKDPRMQQIINDPLVQQYANKIKDETYNRVTENIKPYYDDAMSKYNQISEIRGEVNKLRNVPVIGSTIGKIMQPTNMIYDQIIDPSVAAIHGRGGRRKGLSRMVAGTSTSAKPRTTRRTIRR